MNNKILFFGEKYPYTTNGISIFNRNIIEILKEKYEVKEIIKKGNTKNQINLSSKITSLFHFFKNIITNRKSILYLSIPTSTKGIIILFIQSLCFYILNGKNIIFHLHRGDLENFLNSKTNFFLFELTIFFSKKIIVLDKSLIPLIGKINSSVEVVVLLNTCFENYKFSYNPSKNSFLYVSNYLKEKGIYDLFSAFNYLKNKSLVCYGTGIVSKDFKINENIVINGPIFGKEKFQEFSKYEALIFPSWNEGLPITILEAMSIGLPVISTKVGYIKTLLGENYPLYFESKNIESLIEKIEYFSQIDTFKVSKYLLNRYNKHFHIDIFREKLYKIF